MEEITLSPWKLWGDAIGWTLIGIALVKGIKYPRDTKFDIMVWLNENLVDVLIGILVTLVVVKLGDALIALLSIAWPQLKEVAAALKEVNLDPIQLSLVVAIVVQWKYIEKWRPKLTIDKNSNRS